MDGILLVDKPQRLTSHDVVDLIRRHCKIAKVGHAGTLDPMATGLLVMLIGRATKSANTFLADDKSYEGSMLLGGRSDTGDAWGAITPNPSPVVVAPEAVVAACSRFAGEIEQRPPMYSALKVNGRKLYELARKGVRIETEPRKITIAEFVITEIRLPSVSFRVSCSKGTYIRQLAVDVGEVLGCGAYLSALRRTRSGRFAIGQAITVEKIKTSSAGEIAKMLIGL